MHQHLESDAEALAIFEHLPDAVIIVNTQWRITALNQQAASLLQRTREEVPGKLLWEMVPEALGTARQQCYQQVLQTHAAIRIESWCPSLEKWFQITASPSSKGLALFFQEMTWRKHEAPARRQEEIGPASNHLSQAILDSLTANIAVLNQAGTIIAVNDAWIRFARDNSPSDSLAGTEVGANYLETCRKATEAATAEAPEALSGILAVLDGSCSHFTLEYPCHSPVEERWFLMSATPLPTGEGAVVSHINITERKQAEAAARASEARARRLLEANLIGAVVADTEHILEANDAFLEMVGYTRDDIERHRLNWSAMTPAEYAPLNQRALQELHERGACTPFEKEYYRKDGSRVSILIGAALLQEQPLQWVSFLLDISERKERERRKDEFISMASHELKTPITSLKGFAQLIQRRLKQQGMSDLEQYLGRMQTQLNTLTRLVNDLLDVSKIQAGRLDYAQESVELDALVHEVVEFLQQTTSTHTIRIRGASYAHIVGDRDRLSQVLTNLLTNAIKYSPQAKDVDVQIVPSAEVVTISVRDYGMGIAPAHQSKIFDRFYRVQNYHDKAFPGLGMGLYISQQIVERHGGKLKVTSEEGQGATFSVTLPLLHTEDTAEARAAMNGHSTAEWLPKI